MHFGLNKFYFSFIIPSSTDNDKLDIITRILDTLDGEMTIQTMTRLICADNSGAKTLKCIGFLGKRKRPTIGDTIVVTVKETYPNAKLNCGDIYHALIIRTRKDTARKDGSIIRFENNAGILLTKEHTPVATRVFGPVMTELRGGRFMKILSIAEATV